MRGQKAQIYELVLNKLENEKVYLKSDLSLEDFSSMIGTNTTYLSNTINDKFGVNFRTILNRYRISYAKELLQNGVHVTEIPERCGFASRSTFYAAFVKEEGLSPLNYLRLARTKRLKDVRK